MHDYKNGYYYTRDKEIIELTNRENELLNILLCNEDRFVPLQVISKKMYSVDVDNTTYACIRRFIYSLRQKLKGEIEILSKNKFGYRAIKLEEDIEYEKKRNMGYMI